MASEASFENGGWLETDRLGGGDLEGCSGLRVATHTGGTILDLESSESDDLDFLIFLHACGDGGKDCVEGFFRGTLGGVVSEGVLNG